MPPKRVKYKNPRVESLLREALRNADPPMSIEDFARATGWERNAGAFVRGEVQRPSPDQVNEAAHRLPITVEQILAAYGYAVALTPTRQIYGPLAEFLGPLPQSTQRVLLKTLQDLAAAAGGER